MDGKKKNECEKCGYEAHFCDWSGCNNPIDFTDYECKSVDVDGKESSVHYCAKHKTEN